MGKRIVFYGGGNMAEGMIRDLLHHSEVKPEDITVNELVPGRCEYLRDTYGVLVPGDTTDAVRAADMVIIAVKPKQVAKLMNSLKGLLDKKTIIFSIAAGVKISAIADEAGSDKKVARVIPNTLGESGKGYSAYCLNERCNEQDKMFVEEILGALGEVMCIEENMFNLFQSFASCGPLWLYKMVEALTDAGVYLGFSRQDARNFTIQNMIGAASVLETSGEHPATKVDQMTSPGGITIAALKTLQDEGFAAAIMNSAIACSDKMNMLNPE